MKKIIIILLMLVAVMYGLSHTGKMPQSVYSRLLGFAVAVQGGSGPFDGAWSAKSVSSITETDEAFCGTAKGEFIVAGNKMYGSVVSEFGDSYMVTATLDNGGDFSGGMALGIENVASFSGVLLDSNGSGDWKDTLGCYGTVSFSRITALGSHDSQYVKNISGRVFVVRGVRTLSALPGTVLRIGDVVTVEEGSSATIITDSGMLKISEKTKFEITEASSDKEDDGPEFFGGIWTGLKYLIQGESFEIKTPTAVAGVRG